MSALPPKADICSAAKAYLVDHLVGGDKNFIAARSGRTFAVFNSILVGRCTAGSVGQILFRRTHQLTPTRQVALWRP